jgi:hypothetical protein
MTNRSSPADANRVAQKEQKKESMAVQEQGLLNALNASGYPFQYAVLRELGLAFDNKRSLWRFEAAEFPVAIGNSHTRIDILLSHTRARAYMVAECKRPNKSLRRWCFFRAPFVRRDRSTEYLFYEAFERRENGLATSRGREGAPLLDACHIALDVKGSDPGENSGIGRGAIEQAASQVMRGTAGLIQLHGEHKTAHTDPISFFPVIFTAATLYVGELDLNTASVISGDLDSSSGRFREVPWLFYQYHISPELRPRLPGNQFGLQEALGKILDREYVRTVAVVSPSGIESYLQWISNVVS